MQVVIMARSSFGHVTEVSPGKWRVYWSENGRRKSKTIEGKRADAELFLAYRRIDKSGNVAPSMTYAKYWEYAVVPTFEGLSQRTIYDYTRIWSVELEPRIGQKKVDETTWRYAQAVLSRIEAPSVQAHAYRTWRKVCNLAVRDGLLKSNPIDRNIHLRQVEKREKQIPTRAELANILTRAKDYKHVYLLALEIGAGLRHEEACAVTRADIAFEDERAIVSVSKALTVAGGKVIRKDTKTAFSRRLVACGEPFRSVLEACMDRIPATVAEQSSPVTITRNWLGYCRRNDIPHIPFGQMRTIFSVWHQQAGSVDSLVSLAMGHADGTTRGRNYTVNTLPAMRLLADGLSEWCMRDKMLRSCCAVFKKTAGQR